MNNKEIEARFLDINKDSFIKKLQSAPLQAHDKGELLLSETIFYDPELKWLKESRFVRLRAIGENLTLTYKQNKKQTIDSAYEVEFSVFDKNSAIKFLESIGLVAFRYQEKKRHTFVYSDIIVDIDTWPRIPTYVEIEGPSAEKIQSFSESIGLDWSKVVFQDAKSIIENVYGIPVGTMKYFTFDRFE